MMKTKVVDKLIEDFPSLRDDVESNINDFPEIYLHLIFGDVFNPYLSELLEDPQDNKSQLIKAGELLEYMSNMDNSIQEVVVTTVLERLTDDKNKLKAFSEFVGVKTKQFINELT